MNEKESLAFLEKAQAAGIEFRASLPGKGTFLLSPAEILAYLSFPEKVMARKCKVSIATYKAYKKWYEEGCRCNAITLKGSQCKVHVIDNSLNNYVPGLSEFCKIHQNHLHRMKTIAYKKSN